MTAPLSQAARDRLRAQVRQERELADRVLSAEARLAHAVAKRDAVLAAQDRVVTARQDDVADALISYVDGAGVGLERVAIVLGRSTGELTRLVRKRRVARRTQ